MKLDFPRSIDRHADAATEFLLFVEQFEQAVRMLDTGRVAQQRMALVLLDSLADGLLFRHVDSLFLVSDEMSGEQSRVFPASERKRARDSFLKRVALARERIANGGGYRFPAPILDQTDEIVFRVAHHYRNAIYHEDRHNPTLLEPIGRLYAEALGRAFVRSQPGGWATSCSPAVARELASVGWACRDQYFDPHAAAESVIGRIASGLVVDLERLKAELSYDLSLRCGQIDEDLDAFRIDGLDDAKIQDLLTYAQDWAANRGDELELSLRAEHREAFEEGSKKGWDEASADALKKIQLRQWDHIFGSGRSATPEVDLLTHVKLKIKGEHLRGWTGKLPGLLERYRKLDEELKRAETAVLFALIQWDHHVQREFDAARGK